jgi:hypothetical protein
MSETTNNNLPEKKRRKRKVGAKIIQCLELIASGRVRTQSEAAAAVGITPEWLSKMLKRPETGVLLDEICRKYLRTGKVRATSRLLELLESASGRTSLEASRLVLGIGGIAPPREGGVNINVDINQAPGYVVLLRHRDDPDLRGDDTAPMIDVTPDDRPSSAVPAVSEGYRK